MKRNLHKKYISLSILSGLLFGLSWPVNGIFFLIFTAFIPILLIEKELREKSLLQIYFYSFLSFIIWNTITSWWIINSSVFGMFFAVILYSLLMALVFTFYSLVSNKLGNKLGIIFFVSSWIVFEKFNLEKVGEWWFGTDIMDLYRSMSVLLDEEKISKYAKQIFKEMIHPIMNSTQLEMDKKLLSSEVHLLLKKL